MEGKYFAVERFDRSDEGRIHTISAAGLLNADYRIPSLDYNILLKACHILTKDMEQVYSLFRQMVFNILISNRDDHAKNFSFQLKSKQWCLSPAYDILPSTGFNGYHTSTINAKGEPKMNDIMSIASEIGLSPSKAKKIVDEITSICEEEKMIKYRL
jgi:serine/threonine-protein kinase HipA